MQKTFGITLLFVIVLLIFSSSKEASPTLPIPRVYISTNNKEDTISKDRYLPANISIEANGWGEDYQGETQIRGRGNTTAGMPKKPYRLKLKNKASLFSLAEGKDWILLANYLDPTLMLNAVALKMGQLIGLRFTNHAIPVDLTLNGNYAGSYLLTEQVEISPNRVNIDEKTGVLLELDINYDDAPQFYSKNYKLLVKVKDPKVESEEHFQHIKNDFNRFDDALASTSFPHNNYKQYIDIESVVKFLIVYNLTHNMEINHPKSIHLYKDAGGKYTMGPIWDFDWAYDFEKTNNYFGSQRPLLQNLGHSNATGYTFFSRFLEDPEVRQLYKTTWNHFRTENKEALFAYIDWYAEQIGESYQNDYKKWKEGSSNFEERVLQLKDWLEKRFIYIDKEVQPY